MVIIMADETENRITGYANLQGLDLHNNSAFLNISSVLKNSGVL